jgi:enamine deaminase RidA (YjgF/YER057c/UK114 family)
MGESRSATAEERLAALGLALPEVPPPVGLFRPGRIEGGLLFLSGQGPLLECGALATGKVGRDVSAEDARHHAMRAGLVLVAAAKSVLGDLGRVRGVVKVLGFVNATADFDRHPEVIDGCSSLLAAVFGDGGGHARSAIGVGSLPGHITVEVEAVLAIATDDG